MIVTTVYGPPMTNNLLTKDNTGIDDWYEVYPNIMHINLFIRNVDQEIDYLTGTEKSFYLGLVSLRVEKVEGPDIYCKVVDGGVISDQKGVNNGSSRSHIPGIPTGKRCPKHWRRRTLCLPIR